MCWVSGNVWCVLCTCIETGSDLSLIYFTDSGSCAKLWWSAYFTHLCRPFPVHGIFTVIPRISVWRLDKSTSSHSYYMGHSFVRHTKFHNESMILMLALCGYTSKCIEVYRKPHPLTAMYITVCELAWVIDRLVEHSKNVA